MGGGGGREREREREREEHSRQEEEQYCSKLNGGARAYHGQHGKLSIPSKCFESQFQGEATITPENFRPELTNQLG